MPQAREWTAEQDATIRAMRLDGGTWASIGLALGFSRNTIIERGRRLGAAAGMVSRPVKVVVEITEDFVSDDPERGALPAGHPLTWGLICREPFPRDCMGPRT